MNDAPNTKTNTMYLYGMIMAVIAAFTCGWLLHDLATPDEAAVTVAYTIEAATVVSAVEEEVATTLLININTASAAELAQLPLIGEVRSANIVAHREKYGPFTHIEQLVYVENIGEGILERVTPYITVG